MSKTTFTIGNNEKKEIVLTASGEYVVDLAGEGACVEISGKWNLRDDEQLMIKLHVVHSAQHTSAHTLLRAVLHDSATAEIRGKIIVHERAQHTESFLKEAVLLVSPQARAIAVPDLEIEANEVKCSHAAAVSRVNEEHIYYLTSRGIRPKQAVDMIVEGFLS